MSSQNKILTNVIDKLDEMPIEFDITDIDIVPALNDTMREMKISSLDLIVDNSDVELYIEIRTEWWMLHRLKNSASLNFKYSTSLDGRTIDKTMIPQMIQETMDELNTRFSNWYSKTYTRSTSGVLTIPRRIGNTLK